MSDFSEKEVNTNSASEETEAFSSVFSDPCEHKRVELKKKSVLSKIIASVLVLCILAGAVFAVVKFIPVLDDDTTSSSPLEEITVKNLNAQDVSSVKVTNSVGTTEFYSKTTKQDDTETVNWYIKSIDTALTDSSLIESTVSAFCNIVSTRKIIEKTADECGLVSSKLKAVVTPKKGDAYTVVLGSKSPDNSGYYLKINGSDDIYLVSDDVYSAAEFDVLDFADTTSISGVTNDGGELDEYFSSEQLVDFDRLTLKGDSHPQGLRIVSNKDERTSEYLAYMVEHPDDRIAQNTDALVNLYGTGITVVGAYSYDVSAASVKKFGLDNPDLETEISLGNKKLTYKFALQEDGCYAAISDESRMVYRVEPSVLSGIIELETVDYYANWIFYEMIDDVKTLTLKTQDNTYAFKIKTNETDDDSETEQEKYEITHNGKKLVAENFQNLYQYLISLNCDDFTVDDVSAEPEITLTLDLVGGIRQVIEFTKFSATKYQCQVDGKVIGKVTSSSLNKALMYTEKVANGETVGEIN